MSLVTVTRNSAGHRSLRYGALAAVLVVAAAIPWFFDVYRLGQFTMVLVFAIAILGLNLLVGYAGQISLGHGAFYALGAYVCAILIADVGVPHLLTIPIAGAVCYVAGFLVGIPALRVRGLYLALITLAIAVSFPQLIKKFEGLTGGTQGLQASVPTPPAGLAQDQWVYYIALITAVILFFLASRMVSGRIGRALIAIRDNEIAAKTQGINLATFKTRAFAVSSAYAGIAGALFVFASIGFVSPESFPLADSFRFLAAVVVGGLATIWGAVFGGFFMEFLPVIAQDINTDLTNVIFGAVLILFMYLLPHGVMGLLRWIGARLIEVRPGAAAGAPEAAQPPVGPGDGGPGRSTEETGAPASGMRPAKS